MLTPEKAIPEPTDLIFLAKLEAEKVSAFHICKALAFRHTLQQKPRIKSLVREIPPKHLAQNGNIAGVIRNEARTHAGSAECFNRLE